MKKVETIITDMNCLECGGVVLDYEFEVDESGFIQCPHCGGNDTEIKNSTKGQD